MRGWSKKLNPKAEFHQNFRLIKGLDAVPTVQIDEVLKRINNKRGRKLNNEFTLKSVFQCIENFFPKQVSVIPYLFCVKSRKRKSVSAPPPKTIVILFTPESGKKSASFCGLQIGLRTFLKKVVLLGTNFLRPQIVNSKHQMVTSSIFGLGTGIRFPKEALISYPIRLTQFIFFSIFWAQKTLTLPAPNSTF